MISLQRAGDGGGATKKHFYVKCIDCGITVDIGEDSSDLMHYCSRCNRLHTAEAEILKARRILQGYLGFGKDNSKVSNGIKLLIDQYEIKMQNLCDKHSAILDNIRLLTEHNK